MNEMGHNVNAAKWEQKYLFGIVCIFFSVVYPVVLILAGYFILLTQIDLGVYANIFAISFAVFISERLYVRINKASLNLRNISYFTIYFSIYNFVIQVVPVANVIGVEKALTGNVKFLLFISIGHAFIIYFTFLLLSKFKFQNIKDALK